jgi:hypothetical protein
MSAAVPPPELLGIRRIVLLSLQRLDMSGISRTACLAC